MQQVITFNKKIFLSRNLFKQLHVFSSPLFLIFKLKENQILNKITYWCIVDVHYKLYESKEEILELYICLR